MGAQEDFFQSADLLKELALRMGIKDLSNFAMVNKLMRSSTAEQRDIHKKYLEAADYFKKNGTGKRDALAEAESRRALQDYDRKFKAWEELSDGERAAYGLGGLTPDGVIVDSEPTIVDFFNVATALPAGVTVDPDKIAGAIEKKISGSIMTTLKTAKEKLNKYDKIRHRIIIANISDFPESELTDGYILKLKNAQGGPKAGIKKPDGAELWVNRGFLMKPVFT
jgi:hypothetical protein